MSLPTQPYIQILQGHDGMQGLPGPAGTPGRDGNNYKFDDKGNKR